MLASTLLLMMLGHPVAIALAVPLGALLGVRVVMTANLRTAIAVLRRMLGNGPDTLPGSLPALG